MLKVGQRGQSSFEIVLVTVFILAVVVAIMGYYFNIHDSTIAMSIAKSELLDIMNSRGEFYFIERIDFEEVGLTGINVLVVTDPNTFNLTPQEKQELEKKIYDNTKYVAGQTNVLVNNP